MTLSMYRPGFAKVLVYMMQSVEYRPGQYVRWFWRTHDFTTVMRRRTLEPTRPVRLLLAALRAGMLLQLALGLALIIQGLWQELAGGWQVGLALVVSYPIVWAHLIVVPLLFGRWFVILPRQRRRIRKAEKIFVSHPGLRIAVAGSYGKTSMKELLRTVLGEGKKVAATPANKNVASSHADFASGLAGDEDALIIEYGEGRPGDIRRFARYTHPTHAIITGVAPAHLDHYKTLEAAAQDIFSIANFVPVGQVYVTNESSAAQPFITETMKRYDAHKVLGWRVSHVQVSAAGVRFTMSKGSADYSRLDPKNANQDGTSSGAAGVHQRKGGRKGKRRLHLSSGLLGRHNIGPLAFAAAFALENGLSEAQVTAGIAKTQPFEHRMQPRMLGGALIIDDTYNGNLEGVLAGTMLLKELPARRKWYITPGLVDQGRNSEAIHRHMGTLIVAAQPDVVVLMANSAQSFIAAGLQAAGYAGEIRIETDPLEFYTNLSLFVAAGDVVMMQNDWTDNYV